MEDIKIRQSQAINAYGVGSIVDFPSLSVIILSPDAQVWGPNGTETDKTSWGIKYPRNYPKIDVLNRFEDKRLSQLLGVDYFVIPPFESKKIKGQTGIYKEAFPSISSIRFPGTLVCPNCKTIHFVTRLEINDNHKTSDNEPYTCGISGCNNAKLFPTRFIIATSYGHIDDFPWDWFCHKDPDKRANRNSCGSNSNFKNLKLENGDTASIGDMHVRCIVCDAKKSLGSIFSQEATFMDPNDPYLFDRDENGVERRINILAQPWKGKKRNTAQNLNEYKMDWNPYSKPRKSLWKNLLLNSTTKLEQKKYYPVTLQRGAGNIYFSVNHRGICLPVNTQGNNVNNDSRILSDAKQIIETITSSGVINDPIEDLDYPAIANIVLNFLKTNKEISVSYGDDRIMRFIDTITASLVIQNNENIMDISLQTRTEEYECFLKEQKEDLSNIEWYKSEILDATALSFPTLNKFISKVVLLHKFKQLNIQVGFTRVRPLAIDELKFAKSNLDATDYAEERRRMVDVRTHPEITKWLPAVEVKGEGIFLTFKEEIINAWYNANRDWIDNRLNILQNNYRSSLLKFGAINDAQDAPLINYRFVLLHTLSHLLIEALAQDSGYGATSLSEIIYCDPHNPATGINTMNGILIHTSTSDAEGTLGGLVNMGRPESLEEVFRLALSKAQWCSSDPICIETKSGQGFMGLNMSACYACCLLPETSCENMNKFLDRALLVGDLENPDKGFFRHLGYI
jgi:hypothetical protein